MNLREFTKVMKLMQLLWAPQIGDLVAMADEDGDVGPPQMITAIDLGHNNTLIFKLMDDYDYQRREILWMYQLSDLLDTMYQLGGTTQIYTTAPENKIQCQVFLPDQKNLSFVGIGLNFTESAEKAFDKLLDSRDMVPAIQESVIRLSNKAAVSARKAPTIN